MCVDVAGYLRHITQRYEIMKKRRMMVASICLIMSMALLVTSVAFAAVSLKGVRTWQWTDRTFIWSVASGDVDGDGETEIITGGQYDNGPSLVAQLCVWNGATLAFENVQTWDWGLATYISAIAIGDVDGDKEVEIVTGGYYWDGTRNRAQLCVWNGKTLTLDQIRTWYWTDDTVINAVAVADVDNDGDLEIVTGGHYHDAARYHAQLCVWTGTSLTLEAVQSWYWTSSTHITSLAVGDVDDDAQVEVVTGGYYHDGTRTQAQLCVWTGTSLALEAVQSWYWTSDTEINSVAIGDVDEDKEMEIVTGGNTYDGTQRYAQLSVWNGATLAFENIQTWVWGSATYLKAIAIANVDGDSQMEIVTGGDYYSSGFYAQLCVWSGSLIALEEVRTWRWISNTRIQSVALSNVDSDASLETITGGYYDSPEVAQLTVWE
jgi:hypothetical protein